MGSVVVICPSTELVVVVARALANHPRFQAGREGDLHRSPLEDVLSASRDQVVEVLKEIQADLAPKLDWIPELQCVVAIAEESKDCEVRFVVSSDLEAAAADAVCGLVEIGRYGSARVGEAVRVVPGSCARDLGDAGPSLFSGDQEVFFFCPEGSTVEREVSRLAPYFRARRVGLNSGGRLVVEAPVGLERGGVVRDAMVRVVTWGSDEQSWDQIALDGLDLLIKRGDSGLEPTATLVELANRSGGLGLRPSLHSATAAMLERVGGAEGSDYARRLRGNIDHWIGQRIWSANFVPEMVLHDEAHSAGVDLNVALLVEPLLAKGVIGPRDVYILAVAAWLHDWGHASARAQTGKTKEKIPSDPIEVRNYHGLLTAWKLSRPDEPHGLAQQFASEVSLLCGHHQGWTSCDDKRPKLPQDRRIPHFREASDAKPLGAGELGVQSFKAACAALDLDEHYDRMCGLLALFRIADACDIGQHRAPNSETQGRTAENLLQSFVDRAIRDREVTDDAESELAKVPEAFKRVMAIVQDRRRTWERDRVQPLVDASVEECATCRKDTTTSHPVIRHINHHLHEVADEWLSALRDVDSSSSVDMRQAADVWDYAKHLCRQAAFFAEHERIQMVLPRLVPIPDDSGYRLVVSIVPGVGTSADSFELVESDVAGMALKELGFDVKNTNEWDVSSNKSIREHLMRRFDVRAQPQKEVRFEVLTTFRPPETQVAPEESARELPWIPYGTHDGSRVLLAAESPVLSAPLDSPRDRWLPDSENNLTVSADGVWVVALKGRSLYRWSLDDKGRAFEAFPRPLTLPEEVDGARVMAVAARGGGTLLLVLGYADRTVALEVSWRVAERARWIEEVWGSSSRAVVVGDQRLRVSTDGAPDPQLRRLLGLGPSEIVEALDAASTHQGGWVVGALTVDGGTARLKRVVVGPDGTPVDQATTTLDSGAVGIAVPRRSSASAVELAVLPIPGGGRW